MYKHIKAKCSINPGWPEEATLTIVKQTHVDIDFSSRCRSVDTQTFIHKNVVLISSSLPEFVPRDDWPVGNGVDLTLYVGGSYKREGAVIIPSHEWPRIKEAIQAYNEYFKE